MIALPVIMCFCLVNESLNFEKLRLILKQLFLCKSIEMLIEKITQFFFSISFTFSVNENMFGEENIIYINDFDIVFKYVVIMN